MKYYIYIAVLIGCIYSKSPVDNNLMLSLSASNIAYTMLDNAGPGYHMAFSLGYTREDSKTIESGLGFQYLLGINQDTINESSSNNKKLFGLSIFSFVEIPWHSTSIGLRSFFDFGFSNYNFIFGPTIGYSFNLNSLDININYFGGCSDFINFSRFTNSMELRIVLPFKGIEN